MLDGLKNKRMLAGIGIVLVMIVIVIFVICFSGSKKEEKNDNSSEQDTTTESIAESETEESSESEITTQEDTSAEVTTQEPTTTETPTEVTTTQTPTTQEMTTPKPTEIPTTMQEITTQTPTTQVQQTVSQNQTATKPSGIGALQVIGTNLCDSSGNPVQLTGVSTHGINWFPQYVNSEAFASLKSFGANAVRLAMYTNEYNGYCSGGNKEELKNLIHQGVTCATELGMYVIIDWHILSDGNPNTYLSEAIAFWSEMSAIYANSTNVIYEICNEPNGGVAWDDGGDYDVKSYAEKVIDTIRTNDKDAVIIVGTPTWSQDVDIVADSPLDTSKYQNIMYALHFYAATHYDYNRDKLIKAHEKGLPVFVSEFSICEASGNGRLDTSSGDTWINLLDSYDISYMTWSLANKAEAASLLNSWCDKTGGFTTDDFTETGKWYLNVLAR